MNIENTDTFGNYMIHGIDEIILPEAVSWWLSAPGWQFLGFFLGVVLLVYIWRLTKRWYQNRYRRKALQLLEQLEQNTSLTEIIAKLPFYIKTTALHAYPRTDVASLTGNDWLAFLDDHYSGPSFQQGTGRHLLTISYQSSDKWQFNDDEATQLLNMSRQWIANHKVVNHV